MNVVTVKLEDDEIQELLQIKQLRRTKNSSQVIREALHFYLIFLSKNIDLSITNKDSMKEAK